MIPLDARAPGPERMDDPSIDPATFAHVLRDLAQVNRVTLAHRPTIGFLERALAGRDRFRLLDVGHGAGDMLRRIARWAERRGKRADLVGVDLDPRSRAAAEAMTPGGGIRWVTGDYADLAGGDWDVVVSSLVAHHMTHAELVAFLRFMEAEAAAGWMVNDLHRHRVAHLGYPLLAAAMRWHPIVRADGRLSIARSFRPAEWRGLLADAGIRDAAVRRHFPYRLCVERLR